MTKEVRQVEDQTGQLANLQTKGTSLAERLEQTKVRNHAICDVVGCISQGFCFAGPVVDVGLMCCL